MDTSLSLNNIHGTSLKYAYNAAIISSVTNIFLYFLACSTCPQSPALFIAYNVSLSNFNKLIEGIKFHSIERVEDVLDLILEKQFISNI